MRLLAMRSLVLALVLGAPVAAVGQQSDEAGPRENSDRITFDFSFDYDPEELRANWAEKVRIKKIWGPIGIAGYHIFPAAESGPALGPPMRIWANGVGTSLWRNPVTGWPEQ